ncbi:MAG: polysaccharide biosynthesis tyrosine autokinase [Phycisphaerae bacterium]
MVEQPHSQHQSTPEANVPATIVPSSSTGVVPLELTEPGGGFLDVPGASGNTPRNAFSASMLLRCKWLIFGVFVLVSGITVPCIWLFIAPVYQATAVVRVSPVVSRIVFRTEDNGIVPLYRSYLNTQVSIIRSPTVLHRVLDRAEVRQTRWYQEEGRVFLRAPLSPVERLKDALSVRPRPHTELIDVSVSARDAKEARLLVGTVVDEYKGFSDESLRESDVRRIESLVNERVGLQSEIDGLVATKFNLSKRLGTTGPEELRSQLTTQLSFLESQIEERERGLAMIEWDLETLRSERGTTDKEGDEDTDEAQSGIAHPRYTADTEWRRLDIELDTTRHHLELARQQYGESHPRIRELLASIDHAERLLRQRELQLDDQWQNASLQTAPIPNRTVTLGDQVVDRASLERQAGRLQHQIELLNEAIEQQRRKVADAGEVAQDIAQYDEEIRHKRELYDAVRSRLTQLEMESKAPARIAVAAYAVEPSRPYRDRRLVLTVMALLGAMMLGLGLGYLRVALDSKIHEAGDVRYAVRVPFLGQLPPLPTTADLMADAGPELMESVRMVRTALLERLNDSAKNVVLITSSTSQTGKTSVAVLLARSLACLGRRTLLVEADLRRPSLSQRLNVRSTTGLAALLTGTADDKAAIVPTGVAKLDVLPAGQQPEEFSSELLANGVFATCVERWKSSYDFVVLDSPPVLPVADARILAGQADGTILVLRSAHCRRAEVLQAYADLSAGGGTLLGTILIGVRFGTGYGYYGDYRAYGDGSHAPSNQR